MAQRCVSEFDRKWLRGGAPADEAFNNGFDIIRGMKLVPFTKEGVVQLAMLALLPVLPLTLTLISIEDLMNHFLKVLF
jgi:hypothetical protein